MSSARVAGDDNRIRTYMSSSVRAGVADLQHLRKEEVDKKKRKQGFLAQSASVNRKAAHSEHASLSLQAELHKFYRDGEANFEVTPGRITRSGVASVQGPTNSEHLLDSSASQGSSRRDDALRIVENLQWGPSTLSPPQDDAQFLYLEPNSGISLRKRILSHTHLQDHLEGRYVLMPSVLYSISLDIPSHDGDVTVPVEGEWVTMGVLVGRSDIKESNADPVDGEEKRMFGTSMGLGSVQPDIRRRRHRTYTLVDLSRPPEHGEQSRGDDTFHMTLYEAEESWVDESGIRHYSGGSAGAFEKMNGESLGVLICLLNPRIMKSKNIRQDRRGPVTNANILKPRNANSIVTIGMARDYRQCLAKRRDGQRCTSFVDARTQRDICEWHLNQGFSKSRQSRQELASGTFSLFKSQPENANFAYSDGPRLSSHSKPLVVESNNVSMPKSNPSSQFFNVQQRYGREREEMLKRKKKENVDTDLTRRLSQGCPRPQRDRKAQATHDIAQHQSEQPPENPDVFPLHHSRIGNLAVDAAREYLQTKKRKVSNPNIFQKEADRHFSQVPRDKHSSVGKGSLASSKLLARYSAPATSLPRPILREKKKKGIGKPSVRPPKGESFYPNDISDDEFEAIAVSQEISSHLMKVERGSTEGRTAPHDISSDSDIELV